MVCGNVVGNTVNCVLSEVMLVMVNGALPVLFTTKFCCWVVLMSVLPKSKVVGTPIRGAICASFITTARNARLMGKAVFGYVSGPLKVAALSSDANARWRGNPLVSVANTTPPKGLGALNPT